MGESLASKVCANCAQPLQPVSAVDQLAAEQEEVGRLSRLLAERKAERDAAITRAEAAEGKLAAVEDMVWELCDDLRSSWPTLRTTLQAESLVGYLFDAKSEVT